LFHDCALRKADQYALHGKACEELTGSPSNRVRESHGRGADRIDERFDLELVVEASRARNDAEQSTIARGYRGSTRSSAMLTLARRSHHVT
jgi:hypothetical protein